MSIDLEAALQAAARMVDAAPRGDPDVGANLRALLGALARFDEVVIFAYRGKERPVELFSTFAADEHAVFVTLYQAGPYLLDPFYHRAIERQPGVWRMSELAPDRFFASEYRRTYYVQTGLAEEVGFFVPLDGEVSVVVSLMRKERSGIFSRKDLASLRLAAPLVTTVVRRFWTDLGQRFEAGSGAGTGRRAVAEPADSPWNRLGLTRREASIAEFVLQGHSSESIGLKLGISTGTVKVHRRNVYRKLRISSQAQLMSRYIERIAR